MTDLVCHLIKANYGTLEDILQMPMHLIRRYFKWVMNNLKSELKAQQDYDIAFLKASSRACPLKSKSSKSRK